MNDLDPAKMSDAERTALFASFTQGMTPAAPPRQSLSALLKPWIPSIRAQRALGFDYQQLASICDTHLKIKVSARTLKNILEAAGSSTKRAPKSRPNPAKAATPAAAAPKTSGSPALAPNKPS